ncbi:hypothetical protein H9Q74_004123 [Fusarium xylarioides]|nr:hypothetical protein H9Q71_004166 [Fusarium xylarioides]KAG5825803.1 hypothetical protein H9Q74_004123 [Fusarium xylarioides]
MASRIPTIKEIRASTEVLSPPDASATVVKVGDNFAVKFGHTVSSEEAEAFQFISSNTKVPVPEFYATLVEPETGINFIVMEYINARSLGDLWPSLAAPDKLEITNQLHAALQDLRSLEPPSYMGSVNRRPLTDGVFWNQIRTQPRQVLSTQTMTSMKVYSNGSRNMNPRHISHSYGHSSLRH